MEVLHENMDFIETSVKTISNVDEVFIKTAREIYEKRFKKESLTLITRKIALKLALSMLLLMPTHRSSGRTSEGRGSC